MSELIIKEVILKTLTALEKSGDIVIVHPSVNAVANKIFTAVQEVSPNLLTEIELGAIVSALYAPNLGFGLDDSDFQTIIGVTKAELNNIASKLKL